MIAPFLVAAFGDQVRTELPITAAMTAFTREILTVAPVNRDENLVLSPFSISSCLALLVPGTAGREQQQLVSALKFQGVGSTEVTNAFRDFQRGLGPQLQIANGVWTAPHYALTKRYAASLAEDFGGEARTLPNVGPAAVQEINQWVSEKTKGRIPRLFQSISPSTIAVLANAMSFDGQWQHPFRSALTAPKPFHELHGKTTDVLTMTQNQSLMAYKGADYSAVEIPYRQGGYSMLVLLPSTGHDPMHLLKTVDLSNLPQPGHYRVDLQLPKFKISSQMGLTQSLRRLGLGNFATGFSARPMLGSGQRLTISQFLHAATIEVDENGTRASAATGIAVATAMRREDALAFHVDRPFAFVVWTTDSHVPLFVGTVYTPKL